MCVPQFNENQSHLRPKASQVQVAPSAGALQPRGMSLVPTGGRGTSRANAALQSLGASIFHASGAVFVFMQIARAARWARAWQPHPSADCSLLPTLQPGLVLPVLFLHLLSGHSPSWTPGTQAARGQVAALGDSQVEGPHGERGDSCLFSARPCRFLFSHEEPGRWAARGSCPSFQVKSPGHPASQGQSCSRHLPAAQSSSHRTPHEP